MQLSLVLWVAHGAFPAGFLVTSVAPPAWASVPCWAVADQVQGKWVVRWGGISQLGQAPPIVLRPPVCSSLACRVHSPQPPPSSWWPELGGHCALPTGV